MKKHLSIILVVFVLAVALVSCFAGNSVHASEGLEFTLNDDGVSYSVIGIGTCTDNDIVIPSTYNELPVTSIGNSAFSDCTSLTSIDMGDSVTSIGDMAFVNCTSLTSILIPDSVTSIGDAFNGCDSLKYNEYDSALYLGNQSNPYLVLVKVKDTNITNCTIHSNTKFIHQKAFFNCTSLTSVLIPDSVTYIGWRAFSNCISLTIYCEAESQPSGWDSDWNYSNRPVVCGYTGE